MQNEHKISIVTPSYNQGRFIEDAIKSVLEQGYPNFEHIIIDGRSTDETLEVLKKYPHLIWVSEPDEGQSDAVNKGLKLAKGEIIGWLNSDDYYLPGTFLKVADKLNDPKVDGVYSNVIFVDENKNFKKKLTTHRPIKWLSVLFCFIPSTTFFFKRKVIDKGIYIDKDFDIAMDKEFFAHILYSNFNLRFVNDYFACFRWHKKNKSLDTPRVKKSRKREGLIILNRYSSFKLPTNRLGILIYVLLMKVFSVYRKFLKMTT